MVPLDPSAARFARSWLGPPEGPGLLALRHALVYRRPGLWGDRPVSPQTVVLLREGEGRLEAFGAGEPGPAVDWLVGQLRGLTLHAPDGWLAAVDARLDKVEFVDVETWSATPERMSDLTLERRGPRIDIRRLTFVDANGFTRAAPSWALHGWRTFAELITHAAAFGVPHGPGFASLAWIFDQADCYDAVAVFTAPRYRRLGLGRAAASALIRHIVDRRGKVPLWSTPASNTPSLTLADSLGFSLQATESLARWTPRVEHAR
jgi:GNAT superfamily N-acetyltransferase